MLKTDINKIATDLKQTSNRPPVLDNCCAICGKPKPAHHLSHTHRTLERTESLSHLRMFVAERLHLQGKRAAGQV